MLLVRGNIVEPYQVSFFWGGKGAAPSPLTVESMHARTVLLLGGGAAPAATPVLEPGRNKNLIVEANEQG